MVLCGAIDAFLKQLRFGQVLKHRLNKWSQINRDARWFVSWWWKILGRSTRVLAPRVFPTWAIGVVVDFISGAVLEEYSPDSLVHGIHIVGAVTDSSPIKYLEHIDGFVRKSIFSTPLQVQNTASVILEGLLLHVSQPLSESLLDMPHALQLLELSKTQ